MNDLELEDTMKAGRPTCPSLPETFLVSALKVPEKTGTISHHAEHHLAPSPVPPSFFSGQS